MKQKQRMMSGRSLQGTAKRWSAAGGLGGVMEAACRGAHENGGLTAGIVPDTGNGNLHLSIVIRTGYTRNVLVVQSADAVIAVGGSYGTLSEIAIALKQGPTRSSG